MRAATQSRGNEVVTPFNNENCGFVEVSKNYYNQIKTGGDHFDSVTDGESEDKENSQVSN